MSNSQAQAAARNSLRRQESTAAVVGEVRTQESVVNGCEQFAFVHRVVADEALDPPQLLVPLLARYVSR